MGEERNWKAGVAHKKNLQKVKESLSYKMKFLTSYILTNDFAYMFVYFQQVKLLKRFLTSLD